MSRTLGDAWVTIHPRTDTFKTDLLAGVRKAMTGVEAKVPVTFDFPSRTQVQAQVTARTTGVRAEIPVKLTVDTSGTGASLAFLRAELQRSGIADLADVNVPAGRIRSQLLLIKRAVQQVGLNDLLDVNATVGQLEQAVRRLTDVTTTIPVTFSVGDLKLPEGESVTIPVLLAGISEAEAALEQVTRDRTVHVHVIETASGGIPVTSSVLRTAAITGATGGGGGPGALPSSAADLASSFRAISSSASLFDSGSTQFSSSADRLSPALEDFAAQVPGLRSALLTSAAVQAARGGGGGTGALSTAAQLTTAASTAGIASAAKAQAITGRQDLLIGAAADVPAISAVITGIKGQVAAAHPRLSIGAVADMPSVTAAVTGIRSALAASSVALEITADTSRISSEINAAIARGITAGKAEIESGASIKLPPVDSSATVASMKLAGDLAVNSLGQVYEKATGKFAKIVFTVDTEESKTIAETMKAAKESGATGIARLPDVQNMWKPFKAEAEKEKIEVPVLFEPGSWTELQSKITGFAQGLSVPVPIAFSLTPRSDSDLADQVRTFTRGLVAKIPVMYDLDLQWGKLQEKVTEAALGVRVPVPVRFDMAPSTPQGLQGLIDLFTGDVKAVIEARFVPEPRTDAELQGLVDLFTEGISARIPVMLVPGITKDDLRARIEAFTTGVTGTVLIRPELDDHSADVVLDSLRQITHDRTVRIRTETEAGPAASAGTVAPVLGPDGRWRDPVTGQFAKAPPVPPSGPTASAEGNPVYQAMKSMRFDITPQIDTSAITAETMAAAKSVRAAWGDVKLPVITSMASIETQLKAMRAWALDNGITFPAVMDELPVEAQIAAIRVGAGKMGIDIPAKLRNPDTKRFINIVQAQAAAQPVDIPVKVDLPELADVARNYQDAVKSLPDDTVTLQIRKWGQLVDEIEVATAHVERIQEIYSHMSSGSYTALPKGTETPPADIKIGATPDTPEIADAVAKATAEVKGIVGRDPVSGKFISIGASTDSPEIAKAVADGIIKIKGAVGRDEESGQFISLGATVDASGIPARITAAIVEVNKEIKATPVEVPVSIDTSSFANVAKAVAAFHATASTVAGGGTGGGSATGVGTAAAAAAAGGAAGGGGRGGGTAAAAAAGGAAGGGGGGAGGGASSTAGNVVAVSALAAAYQKLRTAMTAANAAASGGGGGGGGGGGRLFWGGWLGGLNASIGGIKAWHLVLDGAIEALIVLASASAAAAVGISAMTPAAKDVMTQLKAMDAVHEALGVQMYSNANGAETMSSRFDTLAKSLAPQVVEAYGGAMEVVGHSVRTTTGIAHQFATAVDDVAAKLVIWDRTQGGFGTVLQHGMGFLQQLTSIAGNFGSALDNLLKASPGTAHALLDVINAFAGLLNWITKLPQPILQVVLAIHSIYIWTGPLIAVMARFPGVLGAAASAFANLTKSMGFLAGTALKLGIGALVYLIYELGSSWNKASPQVQSGVDSITAALNKLTVGQQQVYGIAKAVKALSQEMTQLKNGAFTENFSWNLGSIVQQGGSQLRAFGSDVNSFFKDLSGVSTVTKSFGDLGRAFTDLVTNAGASAGDYANNLNLIEGRISSLFSGLSRLDNLTGNLITHQHTSGTEAQRMAQAFAIEAISGVQAGDSIELMNQKVTDTINGYAEMGVQGSLLTNSINAITFAAGLQNSQVQNLNSSWDTFIGTVTGSETAFLNFAQGLSQISSAAAGVTSGITPSAFPSFITTASGQGAAPTSAGNALTQPAQGGGGAGTGFTGFTTPAATGQSVLAQAIAQNQLSAAQTNLNNLLAAGNAGNMAAGGIALVTGQQILAQARAQNTLNAATTTFNNLLAQGPATAAQKQAAQQGLTNANQSAAQAQLNLNNLLASGTATPAQLAAAHKVLANALNNAGSAGKNLNKVYNQKTATQSQLLKAANAEAAAQNRLNILQQTGIGTTAKLAKGQGTLAQAANAVAVAQNKVNALSAAGTGGGGTGAPSSGAAGGAGAGTAPVTVGTFGSAANGASIVATQAFQQQLSNAEQIMNGLTTQSAAAGLGNQGVGLLTQSTKDLIATLLPAAKGSHLLTSELGALAQRGGAPASVVNSWQALSKWVGSATSRTSDLGIQMSNVKNPADNLQQIIDLLTKKSAGLTVDVQNLSTALGQGLTGAEQAAIISASGTQTAMSNFAKAALDGSGNVAQLQGSADQLGKSLIQISGSTPQGIANAKTQFESFAIDGLHLTKGEADNLWNTFTSSLTPAIHDNTAKTQTLQAQLSTGLSPVIANLAQTLIPGARQAMHDFAVAVLTTGNNSTATAGARATLISDLEKAGIKAQDATTLVDNMQTSIDNLHGKNVAVTATATGQGGVTIHSGSISAPVTFSSTSGAKGMRTGGLLGGFGGGDMIPALLEPGEAVVDKMTVRRHASKLKEMGVPGFATGGVVGGYVNPIPAGATPERVDQGVDFSGAGPILALGKARIVETNGGGWPGGPYMSYQLLDGIDKGQYVYVAENIRPLVNAGQVVQAGAKIAQMFNGGTGIETGWAGPGGAIAASQFAGAGGINGGNLPPGGTVVGRNFENLLVSLGAPAAPNLGQRQGGTLPAFLKPGGAPAIGGGGAVGTWSAGAAKPIPPVHATTLQGFVDAIGDSGGAVIGQALAPVLANVLNSVTPQDSGGGGGGVAPATGSELSWIKALLVSLGAPASAADISSLTNWIARETPWPPVASWNPLNTTQNAPGATTYNGVGVKNYPSALEGIQATVQTLNNGNYRAIVAALKAGTGLAGTGPWNSELSTWSGGGYSRLAKGGLVGMTAGGLLGGFGGGDQVPALLEPGEAVVDKMTTRRHALTLKAMGVPGFATGGRVGSQNYAGSELTWIKDLLVSIGAPASSKNISSMTNWIRHETPWPPVARWNPLDTEQREPGSWRYNSAGVQNYPNVWEGLNATDRTLENGYYPAILGALRAGKGLAGNGPWNKELLKWSNNGYSHLAAGGLVGTTVGGVNPGGPLQHPASKPKTVPETAETNAEKLAILRMERNYHQKQMAHVWNAMNYDTDHGLTAKLVADKGTWNAIQAQAATEQAEINSLVAWMSLSPLQQAEHQATVDQNALNASIAQANADFAAVEADQAILAKLKKGTPAWQKEAVALHDSEKYFLRDNKIVNADQKVYNAAVSLVKARGGSFGPGGPGLQIPASDTSTAVMRAITAVTTDPLLKTLIGGPGSVSPLGWALQPVLGDLMTAYVFRPELWQGKPSSNAEYAAIAANWEASRANVQQFMNNPGNNSLFLAGQATGIHGTDQFKRRFDQGGILNPGVNVVHNMTGAPEWVVPGKQVRAAAHSATSVRTGQISPDAMMLAQKLDALICELQRNTAVSSQQGASFGNALNGTARRAASVPRGW